MELDGQTLLELSGVEADNLVGIIGGPPCQGFSSIGHGDINDTRNQLFEKFFILIEQLKPAFFVAENVPGIMNSMTQYEKEHFHMWEIITYFLR